MKEPAEADLNRHYIEVNEGNTNLKGQLRIKVPQDALGLIMGKKGLVLAL